MTSDLIATTKNRGSSLIEVVISLGVLAVAVPLVFGALAESGISGQSAEAETRSTWMVGSCMEEIRAAREGRPQFFPATPAGVTFPPAGEIWALAFSAEGRPTGRVPSSSYAKGCKELNGQPIRYFAMVRSAATTPACGVPMLRAHITIEFPAALPVEKRRRIDFHSRIP